MTTTTFQFNGKNTRFLFDSSFEAIDKLVPKDKMIIVTDENVFGKNRRKFADREKIVIKAGEVHKNQRTVDTIINRLITLGADRRTFLVGVGGGVVTDMTGYIAGIYMRGLDFGFVPTTVLAMVDAAIGGKNGVDVGVYKNMVGLIRQPAFLLYDYSFLNTLPRKEWINGFAEIIKHACIKDAAMFRLLEKHRLADFQGDIGLLNRLVRRNAEIKARIVQEDEFEQADRKLLNFGHTLGHAIENTYELPHGHGVSIGMTAAARLSENLLGFRDTARIVSLIKSYHLPAFYNFDPSKAMRIMQSDKKRIREELHYVLLEKIGKAVIKPLTINEIYPVIKDFAVAG